MKKNILYVLTLLLLSSLVVRSGSMLHINFLMRIDRQIKSKVADFFAPSLSLTKTDATRSGAGTINAAVRGEEYNATIVFEYWNTTTPQQVLTTTMPISGLQKGTYTVRATMTGDVVEQAEATITIANYDQPLQLSAK